LRSCMPLRRGIEGHTTSLVPSPSPGKYASCRPVIEAMKNPNESAPGQARNPRSANRYGLRGVKKILDAWRDGSIKSIAGYRTLVAVHDSSQRDFVARSWH
jgi:hypothetical protein